MATPVGHYLVGLSIAQGITRNQVERKQAMWLGVVAVLPDLDVLPGLLVGNLGKFHHDVSHSLLAAIVFSIVGSLLLIRLRSKRALYLSIVYFLVYASHLGLDFVTLDAGAPFGIPLFWPVITQTFQSPWLILPNVQHTDAPLFSVHNALLVIRELLIFIPLVGLTYRLRGLRFAWPKSSSWLYGSWFLIAIVISAYSVR